VSGWEDIRAEVLNRIRSRDWPPGALIPGEALLAAEFGVARATVNRALTELARSGLLERRRKAGTRVAALPVRKATLDIPVIRAEIAAMGQRPAHRLLQQRQAPPPAAIAARLAWAPDAPMLFLQTLHLADGRPHVLETRWLNPTVLPQPTPDFALVSINEWLVANVAFASGDIAFSAEEARPEESAALDCPTGAAIFVTERTTFGDHAAITHVRLAHAPGYRLQTLL
jgi:GntR family transcriptional regulator, histidine utilization repressor